ncbi:MAG: nuclear transport factor 2 family protein [Chloroflexi bacterium]|nr:nuclear transport factor 2 family protein [Chloroflexota bacterium]
MSANIDIVTRFCEAWSRRNVAELVDYFTEDAIYHNMPGPPIEGKPAIKTLLQQILTPITWAEWEMLNIAAADDVVLTERVDRFDVAGKRVELPVAGVFQIEGGKIKAWRDYFDMATWTRQTAPAG